MEGQVHIERSAWYSSNHTYNVVAEGKVVFTGSWRECYVAARELDGEFRAAYDSPKEEK